jgi:hypothetical protein
MRAFAQSYPDEQIVQGVLAQITWYHNIALLEKLKKRNCSTGVLDKEEKVARVKA